MRNTIVRVLAGTLLLAPGPGLLLAQSNDESGHQQFDVYLRDLEAKRTDFEKLVMEELNPQRSEIRESFKMTIGKLDDHLVALRQNPNDEQAKAAYEEKLSLAITQAMGLLGDYQNLEERTIGHIDRMSKALKDARQACIDQQKVSSNEVIECAKRQEAVELQLKALAEKYADLIANDEPLPADIDLEVRLLETDLNVAQQTTAFAEVAQQDMEMTAEDLKLQMAELTELKGSLKISFRKAQGQNVLLGRVASIKERRLSGMQMRKRVQAFGKVIPDLKKDLEDVDGLFTRFLKHDQPSKASGGDKEIKTVPRQGLAILRGYLKPANQNKEKTHENVVVK